MKAILITFDQAHYDNIIESLERLNCRGFTAWPLVQGRGSHNGEPHYGSHAWPSLASAIITVVDDDRADAVMQRLAALNDDRPKLGLRAFLWTVDQTL
jgi:nitrogen regulatory protein PII